MTQSRIPADCDTVARLFRHTAAERGAGVALMHKDFGVWQPIRWRDYAERARHTGLGLADLGLTSHEVVAILAETIPEWLFTDMGILGNGAVSVGLYPTSSAAQVAYIVNDSGARFLFVEDEEQLDKVLERRSDIPRLERVIVYDMAGLKRFSDPFVLSYEELLARGRQRAAQHPGDWDERIDATRPTDRAILVYTSGTTGPPKGAILSHANLIFAIDRWGDMAPTHEGDDTLAFLPLCHMAERMMTAMRPLAYGGVVHFAESPETVLENLREVSPTVFFAVPRIWEKLHSLVTMTLQDATPLQRTLYGRASAIAHAVADRQMAGQPIPPGLALLRAIAEIGVLRNTKRLLGLDRARLIGSGAAPISKDIMRWYVALGIPIFEIYGQTECSGIATFYRPDEYALGTVGTPLPGTEVRLSDEGEIVIRGPHVFEGYLNKPDRTADAIREGWLHTGDIGAFTPEGRLKIVDRKSDIIITSGGKNITPSEIENRLKFSAFVADAIVIGDRRNFLSALIMIDQENVVRYAQAQRITFTDYASLTRAQAIRDLIWSEVENVNRQLANVERIRKIHLLDILLTAEDEEMTPTLKLRRKYVNEKYKQEIEAMYRG
jgi:long-chain acyl-CoA synthetase